MKSVWWPYVQSVCWCYCRNVWIYKFIVIVLLLVNLQNILPCLLILIQYSVKSTKSDTINRTSVIPAFTYVGKDTIFITKLFRYSRLKVAFRSNNTVGTLLKKNTVHNDKYLGLGVYCLTCHKCNKWYVGQTGGRILIWYKNIFKPSVTIVVTQISLNIFWKVNIPQMPSNILYKFYI